MGANLTPRRRLAEAFYRRLIGVLKPVIRAAVQEGVLPLYYLSSSGRHAAVAAYSERYGDSGDLTRFEQKVFSQNGEDGVIAELAQRVAAPTTFVEIGAGDGTESTCLALAKLQGWNGAFVEGDPATAEKLRQRAASIGPGARAVERIVSPDNINDLVTECELGGRSVGVVSIDVDGNDYWLWAALTVCEPAIVVVEYNASFPVDEIVVTPRRAPLSEDGTADFGSSLGAFEALGGDKGYRLAYTDVTGVNAFFVRDDLFARCRVTSVPRRRANYAFTGLGHPSVSPE